MKIVGRTKACECEVCGHASDAKPVTLSGEDSYQYFEVRVAGRRIAFHVAREQGETEVFFVGGTLKQDGSQIHVEVA